MRKYKSVKRTQLLIERLATELLDALRDRATWSENPSDPLVTIMSAVVTEITEPWSWTGEVTAASLAIKLKRDENRRAEREHILADEHAEALLDNVDFDAVRAEQEEEARAFPLRAACASMSMTLLDVEDVVSFKGEARATAARREAVNRYD